MLEMIIAVILTSFRRSERSSRDSSFLDWSLWIEELRTFYIIVRTLMYFTGL